jgi:hypothetical protein
MNAAMSSSVSFSTLDWDEPLPRAIQGRTFDLVLVADCTYNADSSPSLVRTLSALVERSPKAIVLLAMKVRHSSEAVFFDLMSDAGFVIEGQTALPIPGDDDTTIEKVDIFVFHDKSRLASVDDSPDDSTQAVVAFWDP